MAAESPLDFVRKNEERFLLGVYFLVIAGLSVPLADLLRRGWWAGPGNITRTTVTSLSRVGITLGAIQAVAFGMLVGLLTLLVVDRKKRVQGLLLWIGLLLIGGGLFVQQSVPRLFREPGANLLGVALGLGIVAIVAVPTGVSRAVARLDPPESLEFPRAPQLLWVITTVSLVALWLEAHAIYPQLLAMALAGESLVGAPTFFRVTTDALLFDTAAGIAFIALTRRFMRYESSKSITILGPRGAGKTYTMYGAYVEWTERKDDGTPDYMDPSSGMLSLTREAGSSDGPVADGGATQAGGDTTGWALDNTEDLDELSFTITEGEVFPTAKRISSLDHNGEHLEALARLVQGAEPSDVSEIMPPEDAAKLYAHVEQADTLVFLLDTASILDNNSELDAVAYMDLIREYRSTKQLLFAASKADLLKNRFEDQEMLDAYETRNLDEYARFVTRELRRESGLIKEILNNTRQDTLHPVFLMTKKVDGKRLPYSENGRPTAFGYVRLLEKVR